MLRIGQGYDVHQLVEGRELIVGGVKIPYHKGLLGHSDADVLLHALTDAILGALALGDIGKWFPDNDPSLQGIDSKVLIQKVWSAVKEKGFSLGNADITIIAQKPKMATYIPEMREIIANILESEVDQINIKATTTEKLGAIGREEGIASQAVILLFK